MCYSTGMERTILRANGQDSISEVGDDYRAWNDAIGASMGELVVAPDGSVELWCDEEGPLVSEPILNFNASLLVKRPIVGDVIVFYPGDVK